MPQSLSVVYLHLVFSTKERRPFFRDQALRDSLHAYLGSVSARIDCPVLAVGGVEDHLHILSRFSRTIAQADWVREVKRVSSIWLKGQRREFAGFQWQAGYAAFSVSHSNLERVVAYIATQPEHHRKIGFQDEIRLLLRKHQQVWDERHLWD